MKSKMITSLQFYEILKHTGKSVNLYVKRSHMLIGQNNDLKMLLYITFS